MDRSDIIRHLEEVSEHSRYYRARCPFHDDKEPSMLVFEDGFLCLSASCGKRGKLKALWNKIQNVPARDFKRKRIYPWSGRNIKKLAKDAHENLLGPFKGAQLYLLDRGIAKRVIPNWLGWMDGWYTIPLFRKGKMEGLTARAGPTIDQYVDTRYVISPGWGSGRFIPYRTEVTNAEKVFFVYGVFDALYLCALGYPTVTWVPGVYVDPDALADIRASIYIIPDKGEERHARKLAAGLGWRGEVLELDYPKGCKDPNDFAMKEQEELLITQLDNFIERR